MSEERVVNINLRKKVIKDPVWRRREIIVREIKKFFGKKAKEVKISEKLNKAIWSSKDYKFRIIVKKDGDKIELTC